MFSKLVNFRDLGDIKTIDGKRVAKYRLLRSGVLYELPEKEQKELLDKYQLKAIVDFRGDDEIAKNPDDVLSGVSEYHINIMEKDVKTTSQQNLMDQMNTNDSHGLMQGLYRQLIVDAFAQNQYRKFIDVLLKQDEGSVLFHCQAGKDRTGIGAAIILTILGVSKEDIFTDYLKTIEGRREANEQMAQKLREAGKSDIEVERFLTLMSVSADFLEAAYDEADKKFGSFDQYITDALQVTNQERQLLKGMYLAD